MMAVLEKERDLQHACKVLDDEDKLRLRATSNLCAKQDQTRTTEAAIQARLQTRNIPTPARLSLAERRTAPPGGETPKSAKEAMLAFGLPSLRWGSPQTMEAWGTSASAPRVRIEEA